MKEAVKVKTSDHNPRDADWANFDAGNVPGVHVEKPWFRQMLLGGTELTGYGQPPANHVKMNKSSEEFLSNPVLWESFLLTWPQFLYVPFLLFH